jgi:hypothetical protein
MQLMNHVIGEEFADASLLDFVEVVEDVQGLMAALRAALS